MAGLRTRFENVAGNVAALGRVDPTRYPVRETRVGRIVENDYTDNRYVVKLLLPNLIADVTDRPDTAPAHTWIDTEEAVVTNIGEATDSHTLEVGAKVVIFLLDDPAAGPIPRWVMDQKATGQLRRLVLSVAESDNWTAPATTTYQITLTGGGGGGGGSAGVIGGGGGGAGVTVRHTAVYTKNDVVAYTVGAGGAPGQADGSNGENGGDTVFDGVTAVRGAGGIGSAGGVLKGYSYGGVNGQPAIGSIPIRGGSGASSAHGAGGGGGPVYGDPGASPAMTSYGAGGGGGAEDAAGAAGADGVIIIEWVQ